jgi:hypothetical protein
MTTEKEKPKVYIESAGNLTKDGAKAIRDVCSNIKLTKSNSQKDKTKDKESLSSSNGKCDCLSEKEKDILFIDERDKLMFDRGKKIGWNSCLQDVKKMIDELNDNPRLVICRDDFVKLLKHQLNNMEKK